MIVDKKDNKPKILAIISIIFSVIGVILSCNNELINGGLIILSFVIALFCSIVAISLKYGK